MTPARQRVGRCVWRVYSSLCTRVHIRHHGPLTRRHSHLTGSTHLRGSRTGWRPAVERSTGTAPGLLERCGSMSVGAVICDVLSCKRELASIRPRRLGSRYVGHQHERSILGIQPCHDAAGPHRIPPRCDHRPHGPSVAMPSAFQMAPPDAEAPLAASWLTTCGQGRFFISRSICSSVMTSP